MFYEKKQARKAERARKEYARERRLQLEKAAPDLLAACENAEKAFISRNEDEMLQAQCQCTSAITKVKK